MHNNWDINNVHIKKKAIGQKKLAFFPEFKTGPFARFFGGSYIEERLAEKNSWNSTIILMSRLEEKGSANVDRLWVAALNSKQVNF